LLGQDSEKPRMCAKGPAGCGEKPSRGKTEGKRLRAHKNTYGRTKKTVKQKKVRHRVPEVTGKGRATKKRELHVEEKKGKKG